ncbi:MAG: DUF4136 domain-containing protein [Odoribacter sp.]|nr:DUF4136 domain-containing protein [Odoribacter sp.]
MKRLLILLLTGLFAQFLVSCYPEGADKIQDYDVAMTNYDKSADFGTFTTFSIADTVVYFSNENGVTLSHQFDQQIVDLVTANFEKRGYVRVDTTENPSFVVTISAFSNINYAYYVDNWYNNWSWYWGWWGGPFNPYYSWYPVSVYSYRTGSVAIDMISTAARADGKVNVVWTGIADGLLQGSSSFILNRLDKQINQCFAQSPYLRK